MIIWFFFFNLLIDFSDIESLHSWNKLCLDENVFYDAEFADVCYFFIWNVFIHSHKENQFTVFFSFFILVLYDIEIKVMSIKLDK